MRLSGNFHPEWGYLAPVPSVMRTARIVAVATAIGATAGAAVVLSLADRPAPVMAAGAGQSLVVVHSLVQPAEASVPAAPAAPVASVTPAAEPVAAATPAPAPVIAAVPPGPAAPAKAEAPVQAKLQISAPPPVQASVPAAPSSAPPSVTASAENPPAIVVPSAVSEPTVADAAPVAPVPSAAQAAALKKPHVNEHDATRPPLAVAAAPRRKPADNGLAPILRRLFSAHTGNTRAN